MEGKRLNFTRATHGVRAYIHQVQFSIYISGKHLITFFFEETKDEWCVGLPQPLGFETVNRGIWGSDPRPLERILFSFPDMV